MRAPPGHWDWLAFAVRWLHVITAIAWIGSSFYFIALDLGLQEDPGLPGPLRMARSGRSTAAASTTSRNTWWRRRRCRST
jgi:hypothetical protein